jgi:hypothetical protein
VIVNVLHKEKDDAFVLYMKKIQMIGHLLTLTQLKLKVVEIKIMITSSKMGFYVTKGCSNGLGGVIQAHH